jgi:hypothetical protein
LGKNGIKAADGKGGHERFFHAEVFCFSWRMRSPARFQQAAGI